MIEVQAHNNNGLFRRRKYSKSHPKRNRHSRLFIRRSRIYQSLTNNSISTPYNNVTVNYRPPSAQLRHSRVKQNLLHGSGDEHIIPSLTTQQKHVDFTELEQIFDNAIRNRLPLELYKTKSPTRIDSYPPSISTLTTTPPETRIELANPSMFRPVEQNRSPSVQSTYHRKILFGIILVTLSAIIGFSAVLLFVK